MVAGVLENELLKGIKCYTGVSVKMKPAGSLHRTHIGGCEGSMRRVPKGCHFEGTLAMVSPGS